MSRNALEATIAATLPPKPWNPYDPCRCPAQPEEHWHPYPTVISMSPPASGRMATEAIDTFAMTPSIPTSAEIREVAAHLKTLADTFPGIIHAANGSGLSGSPMSTMGALDRACEMLWRYSNDVAEIERKRSDDQAHASRALAYDLAFEEGAQSEKTRAKEARKGRKRGAKKL